MLHTRRGGQFVKGLTAESILSEVDTKSPAENTFVSPQQAKRDAEEA